MSTHTSPKERSESLPSPLWQIAFRPLFLAASLFITFALAVWAFVLSNIIPSLTANYSPFGGWLVWHGHEMVFGFVQAVAIGFLLTASRNWAGQPGINSRFIKALIISWLLARIAWFIPAMPALLVALFDVLTPALAALGLAQTLKGGERDHGKGSQRHNWPFVLLLSAFAIIQIAFHIIINAYPQFLTRLMQAAVLMMAAMTLWVSGRVLPFFTRSKLKTSITDLPQWLTPFSMTASWLIIPCVILNQLFSSFMSAHIITIVVAIAAALGHGYRLFLFYRKGIMQEPMLWSLYVAYAWIVIGYLLIAISIVSSAILPWLHAITLGGLLTMIISMMARISLGHTGRPILALAGIRWVFIGIQAAALIRITSQSIDGFITALLILLIGMIIFLNHYLPILIKPRVDGRAG
jgi:uncharacterized protein involved in response to NO